MISFFLHRFVLRLIYSLCCLWIFLSPHPRSAHLRVLSFVAYTVPLLSPFLDFGETRPPRRADAHRHNSSDEATNTGVRTHKHTHARACIQSDSGGEDNEDIKAKCVAAAPTAACYSRVQGAHENKQTHTDARRERQISFFFSLLLSFYVSSLRFHFLPVGLMALP